MARDPRYKKTAVILVTPSGASQEFELQHAERLLDMGPHLNGGWQLPVDSKYVYDEVYGLRIKTDKANSGTAKEA